MWKNGKEGNAEGRRIMEGTDGRRLKRKKKRGQGKGGCGRRGKGHRADIWQRYEAKHCSSLCSQSEGGEYCGGQARAENPTKSCPRALVMFATCSWPSLCEQSELQCWRRNRRLCGHSANLRCEGATAKLDFLWILNTLPYSCLSSVT